MNDTLQQHLNEAVARHNALELRMAALEQQFTELQVQVKGIAESIATFEASLEGFDPDFDLGEYTPVSAA